MSDLRCTAEPVWWVAVVKPATFACTATSLVSAWLIDLKQWSHAKLKRTFFCLFDSSAALFKTTFRFRYATTPMLLQRWSQSSSLLSWSSRSRLERENQDQIEAQRKIAPIAPARSLLMVQNFGHSSTCLPQPASVLRTLLPATLLR